MGTRGYGGTRVQKGQGLWGGHRLRGTGVEGTEVQRRQGLWGTGAMGVHRLRGGHGLSGGRGFRGDTASGGDTGLARDVGSEGHRFGASARDAGLALPPPHLDMAQVGHWLWTPLRTRAVPTPRLMRTCPLSRGSCGALYTPNSSQQPIPILLPHPPAGGHRAGWALLGHEGVKSPGGCSAGKEQCPPLPSHIWMQ